MPRRIQLAAEEPEGLLIATTQTIDDLICRVFRGEACDWPAQVGIEPELFLSRCSHHGISALLFHKVCERDRWTSWPVPVRQALEEASKAGVARDLLRRHYLRQLIEAFASAEIRVLLLKGEALATSLYHEPGTRDRSDSDVFIPIDAIAAVRRIVQELGYEIVSPIYKSHQFTVMRPGDRSGNLRFDIHWRISNAPQFARMLDFEEAWRGSVGISELEPARMLNPIHSLLLACVHRFGSERHDPDRLIWLHDIHALASTMGRDLQIEFARTAAALNVRNECLESLGAAERCFGSGIQSEISRILASAQSVAVDSGPMTTSRIGLLLDDMRQLESSAERLELLRELLVPRSSDLLCRYGKRSRWWLPVLYLRRVGAGLNTRSRGN